jgi:hypothetical protein
LFFFLRETFLIKAMQRTLKKKHLPLFAGDDLPAATTEALEACPEPCSSRDGEGHWLAIL